MMQEIPYSEVTQQIEKLESQGLIINDGDFASAQLLSYGYSNLIKSYREPYVIKTEEGKKKYRSGVTFEQIASLHELDRNIRNAVMAAMQDLEEYIKEQSSNVIAKSFGTNQNDYIKYRNYQNKRKRIQKYELGPILDTLRDKLTTDKDPIHHYYTQYETVPPWILLKSLYFGTIVNFIDLFKKTEQTLVMSSFLDFENLNISEQSGRLLVMDILFISMEYRNNAAHGGRIYNFNPRNMLRAESIFGGEHTNTHPGLTEFIELLKLLRYKNPYYRLSNVLSMEVNRHCSRFPQDVTYLGQMLNIDIIPCNIVHVSNKSGKFHRNPNCSGIGETVEMEYEDALEKGYQPCKHCVK